MAQVLCLLCRFAMPQYARIANTLTVYLRCVQGVPGAPTRVDCSRFMREPGADDDAPVRPARLRYPVFDVAQPSRSACRPRCAAKCPATFFMSERI
jgi:hypothetical protein